MGLRALERLGKHAATHGRRIRRTAGSGEDDDGGDDDRQGQGGDETGEGGAGNASRPGDGLLVELTPAALGGGPGEAGGSLGGGGPLVGGEAEGMDLLGDLAGLGGNSGSSSSSSSSSQGIGARVDVLWRGDVAERVFAPLAVETIELEDGEEEDEEGGGGAGAAEGSKGRGTVRRRWPVYGMSFHQCPGLREAEALSVRLGHLHGAGGNRDPMGSAVEAARRQGALQGGASAKQAAGLATKAQSARERATGVELRGYWRLAASGASFETKERLVMLGFGGAAGSGAGLGGSALVTLEGWELRRPRKVAEDGKSKGEGGEEGRGLTEREAAVRFAPRKVART